MPTIACIKNYTLEVVSPCGAGTDWINAPGNCRLRIRNFNAADWPMGGCGTCGPGPGIPWDGTFPTYSPTLPAPQYIVAAGRSLNGVPLLTASCDCGYFPLPFNAWYVELACGAQYILTTNLLATGPIGIYNRASGCAGPAQVEIEAYSL